MSQHPSFCRYSGFAFIDIENFNRYLAYLWISCGENHDKYINYLENIKTSRKARIISIRLLLFLISMIYIISLTFNPHFRHDYAHFLGMILIGFFVLLSVYSVYYIAIEARNDRIFRFIDFKIQFLKKSIDKIDRNKNHSIHQAILPPESITIAVDDISCTVSLKDILTIEFFLWRGNEKGSFINFTKVNHKLITKKINKKYGNQKSFSSHYVSKLLQVKKKERFAFLNYDLGNRKHNSTYKKLEIISKHLIDHNYWNAKKEFDNFFFNK